MTDKIICLLMLSTVSCLGRLSRRILQIADAVCVLGEATGSYEST